MERKFASILIFFKIFGLYYEVVNHSKVAKIVSIFFTSFWFLASVFSLLHSIYIGWISENFTKLDFVILFCSIFFSQIECFMIFILTYKSRRSEQQIFRNLNEIDKLMEMDLMIPVNHTRFIRKFWSKVFLQLVLDMGILWIQKISDKIDYTYKNNELPTRVITSLVARIYFVKYIFYIDLLHFRFKV